MIRLTKSNHGTNTTAIVFGNLSFFLKNKIIGFAINAMMAADNYID